MNKKIILICESSWDHECFKKFFDLDAETYLHNDYFHHSNKKNISFANRLKSFFKILSLCFDRNRERVYVSSLNFEGYIPALLASFFRKNIFFLVPNFFNFRDDSFLIKFFFTAFRGKILFTDNLSFQIAKKGILLDKYFVLKEPTGNPKNYVFVVAMPAAYSHNKTSKKAEKLYEEHMKIFEYLNEKKLETYLLPHPRDHEYTNKISNTISQSAIKNFNQKKVCYVSLASSLCLNKRYGGDFGFWCRVDEKFTLPRNIKKIEGHIKLLSDVIP